MNFLARVHQLGGCDYTIECGTQTFWLKADSIEAAIDNLREIVVGVDEDNPRYEEIGSGYCNERKLDRVEIFEIAAHQVCPVQDWYLTRERELQSKQSQEASEAEKQVYLKLKAKYEHEK